MIKQTKLSKKRKNKGGGDKKSLRGSLAKQEEREDLLKGEEMRIR